jgi:hypothetical protein
MRTTSPLLPSRSPRKVPAQRPSPRPRLYNTLPHPSLRRRQQYNLNLPGARLFLRPWDRQRLIGGVQFFLESYWKIDCP